jgi:hypothetical protein
MPPTDDDLRKVSALAARPENRAYFFDRLENPEWVAPLFEGGFFSNPPEPVATGEPGYVRFPPWPEGRYLARVAARAPESVARVLHQLDVNRNPAVTQLLLEAAGDLPNEQLRDLSTNVTTWIGAPFPDYFSDEAASAIARLLEMGDVPAGLSATAALLAVQPDPRLAEKAAISDSPLRPRPEPVGRLSDWEYRRALERIIPVIVDSAGMEGLRLITSLLDDALILSQWNDEDGDATYSYIWRPAIENHPQNIDTGIRNTLVSVLRDAALRLSSRGESDLEDVVRELESRSLVHRRIALHVLANTSDGRSLVSERLADRALFDEYRVRHEYAEVLRLRFVDADGDVRRRVIGWIEEGPDLDEYRRRRTDFDGVPPSDDDVAHYARIWRRDWYSFVAADIGGDDANHYRVLVDELGEPEHPDFLTWSVNWSGPNSPVTHDELLERSPAEVVEYLRTWTPEDDSRWHAGPSVEGLGRVFGEVVKERAEDYAVIAERLAELDPTYVRSFFSGLEGALREGRSYRWDEPLKLAASAVHHPFEPDEEVPEQDRDPGWRWCRRAIASLLRAGFADRQGRIPFRFRDASWQLVDRLMGDPNPTPAHEQRYGGDNMDPFMLSLNTNRGEAMHAVAEYALWVRREFEAAGEDLTRGFDAMPEVRSVLEHHLDPQAEPSLAVRSVYGRWLPWLLLLDEKWVTGHLSDIFPSAPEHVALRETAWATYISLCPPYDSVFRALRSEYEAAIQLVPSDDTARTVSGASVDEKLGEHLVTLYWREVADEAIVDDFFNRADDDLASEVMQLVGRALGNAVGDVPERIRNRIQELWDRRLAVATEDADRHKLEARAFGASFASSKLDESWALETLERAVELAGAPRPGLMVVQRLVDVAATEPAAATGILATMLTHPENEWDYVSWKDEARAIVSRAARHTDPDVVENRAAIIDYYVGRGELDFRDLLGRTQA